MRHHPRKPRPSTPRLSLAAALAVAAPLLLPPASPALAQSPGLEAAAPLPPRKPAPPALPGTTPPQPLATPAPPGVSGRGAPPAATGMRPPAPMRPGPAPAMPDLAVPIPPPGDLDPSARPYPGAPPSAPDTGTVAAPAVPPPLGGVPAPPGSDQVAVAPPPDPGPGRAVPIPGGREFRLVFDGQGDDLGAKDRDLLTGLAARLAQDQAARLQISAYAEGPKPDDRDARRLSLSRALAVREYLVSQGVRSTRIDVRALGASGQGSPRDRVDLVVVN